MSDLEANARSTYDAARELCRDLGKLGESWVRYGLSVGQSSIATSARTLDDAARALAKVADRLRNNG